MLASNRMKGSLNRIDHVDAIAARSIANSLLPGGRGQPLPPVRSNLGPVAPITWMVMSRDVSQFVRVADQPVVIAVLILDVDTGLIRGLSAAEDIRNALSQSVERALNKPADSLQPGYPQQFWRLLAWVTWWRPNSVGNRASPSSAHR